jgi:hypothetical protein
LFFVLFSVSLSKASDPHFFFHKEKTKAKKKLFMAIKNQYFANKLVIKDFIPCCRRLTRQKATLQFFFFPQTEPRPFDTRS